MWTSDGRYQIEIRPSAIARVRGAERGTWFCCVVKRIMGHEGPRTEEKWRRRGVKCARGRSSIMAAMLRLGDLRAGGC